MRVALNGSARYFFPVQQFSGNHLPIDSYLPASTPAAPVIFNQEGNPWFVQVRKAQDDPVVFPEMVPQKVELADGIDLNGYWLSEEGIQPGQPVSLRLFWRVNRTPTADYTTLIHLVQLQGDGSLARVTGFDRRLGDGSCPTTAWLPGEMVVDAAVLTMPEGLPKGDLFLAVGFYTLADGRRMPLRDYDNDQILIGPLPRSPWPPLFSPHAVCQTSLRSDERPPWRRSSAGKTRFNFPSPPSTLPPPSPVRPSRERRC